MKRAVRLGGLLVMLLACGARADLRGDIETILQDKLLTRASVGVEVVRLGAGDADVKPVYEHNARQPLTPASNLKLTTTSAALDRFGPDFKFHTLLLLHEGDLVLVGDGDPSFGDAEYLRRVNWKPTTVYENWADRLKSQGITSVRNVIVDDSVFEDNFLHPHWPTNQIDHRYVAEVGGLNFDQNCVDFVIQPTAPGARVIFSLDPPTKYVNVDNLCVTGQNEVLIGRKPGTNDIVLKGQAPHGNTSIFSETIHDPAMYGATVLAETLDRSGVKVTGAVKRDRTMSRQRAAGPASQWRVVAIHETPLAVALARANKDSVNLYAESLCKRLGHEVTGKSGSWENGTAAVGAFLKKVGVPDAEFHLDDGSGLSKQNAVSPHALVRVIAYDFHGRNRDAFLNSLSISGVDGTLEDRFRGTDLRRRVIGKSGFVEGVSCLSGLLKARDGQWYAFSIMMNAVPHGGTAIAKALQEKIVKAIDAHSVVTSARR